MNREQPIVGSRFIDSIQRRWLLLLLAVVLPVVVAFVVRHVRTRILVSEYAARGLYVQRPDYSTVVIVGNSVRDTSINDIDRIGRLGDVYAADFSDSAISADVVNHLITRTKVKSLRLRRSIIGPGAFEIQPPQTDGYFFMDLDLSESTIDESKHSFSDLSI